MVRTEQQFEHIRQLTTVVTGQQLWRKRGELAKEGDICIAKYIDDSEQWDSYYGRYVKRRQTKYLVGVLDMSKKCGQLVLFTDMNHYSTICIPDGIPAYALQIDAEDLQRRYDRHVEQECIRREAEEQERQRRIEQEAEQKRLAEEERQRQIEEERAKEEQRLSAPANITVRQYEELLRRIEALEDEVNNCIHYRNPEEE